MNRQYDTKTTKAIEQFIDDMMGIFPGLFEKEELCSIIQERMKSNIEWDAELPSKVKGRWNRKERKMYVAPGKKEEIEEVLFHEFIHVITIDPNIDTLIKDKKDLRSLNEIYEILTTLIEEKYVEYKTKEKPKTRVNGYIPDFGHQLYAVIGEPLLRQFLKDSNHMENCLYQHPMFPPMLLKDNQKFNWRKLIDTISPIIWMVKEAKPDAMIVQQSKEVEDLILQQQMFKTAQNPMKDSIKEFETLYQMQFYPQFIEYVRILKEFVAKGILSVPQILQHKGMSALFTIDHLPIEELVPFLQENPDQTWYSYGEKEFEFLSQKLFGFEFYYKKENYNDILADEDFTEEEMTQRLNHYDEEKDDFETHLSYYRMLVEYVLEGNLSYENLKETVMVGEVSKEETEFQQRLAYGQKSIYHLLSRLQQTRTFFLFKDKEMQAVIADLGVYKRKELEEIQTILGQVDPKETRQIVSLLQQSSLENYYIIDEIEEDYLSGEYPVTCYGQDCNGLPVKVMLRKQKEKWDYTETPMTLQSTSIPVFANPNLENTQHKKK